MMGFGWIWMIVFWLFIVAVIVGMGVWLASLLFPRGRGINAPDRIALGSAPPASPAEVLRQRYARGEITREQFEQMKHDLGS